MVTVKVNYAGVRRMAQDLAAASAQPYEKVLKLETASIIKICALNAKIASLAKIKAGALRHAAKFKEPGGSAVVVVNTKRDVGRVWFSYSSAGARIRGVGAFMVFDSGPAVGPARGWHLPDAVWGDYIALVGYREEAIKRGIKARKRARGLMRLSWLQVGDQLGVPLSSVSPQGNLQEDLARAARPSNGRTYTMGTALISFNRTQLLILVTNASLLAIKNQGQRALDGAIARRLKGFEIAVAKGVFDDHTLRAKRWQGIFVSP